MSDGSEFQTVEAATLSPQEEKVVRTQETDNSLVFAERRETCGSLLTQKGMEVSRLNGAESIVGQRYTGAALVLFKLTVTVTEMAK